MNLRISPELIVDRENYINFIYYVCFALTINKFCIIRKPVSKFIATTTNTRRNTETVINLLFSSGSLAATLTNYKIKK